MGQVCSPCFTGLQHGSNQASLRPPATEAPKQATSSNDRPKEVLQVQHPGGSREPSVDACSKEEPPPAIPTQRTKETAEAFVGQTPTKEGPVAATSSTSPASPMPRALNLEALVAPELKPPTPSGPYVNISTTWRPCELADEVEGSSSGDEYPLTTSAPLGPDGLPSVGSAGHISGDCKRCCFHPKGRCQNAHDCKFCHYDHDKRRRLKKKGQRTSEYPTPSSTAGGGFSSQLATPLGGFYGRPGPLTMGMTPTAQSQFMPLSPSAPPPLAPSVVNFRAPDVPPPPSEDVAGPSENEPVQQEARRLPEAGDRIPGLDMSALARPPQVGSLEDEHLIPLWPLTPTQVLLGPQGGQAIPQHPPQTWPMYWDQHVWQDQAPAHHIIPPGPPRPLDLDGSIATCPLRPNYTASMVMPPPHHLEAQNGFVPVGAVPTQEEPTKELQPLQKPSGSESPRTAILTKIGAWGALSQKNAVHEHEVPHSGRWQGYTSSHGHIAASALASPVGAPPIPSPPPWPRELLLRIGRAVVSTSPKIEVLGPTTRHIPRQLKPR